MAAPKIIKGRDLMLFDGDGHSYAYATNHVFTLTAETTDISSKDHGIWGAQEVSRYTWEITSENLYTDSEYDKMFTALVNGNPINVRFGLKVEQVDLTKNVADGNTVLPYWTSRDAYYEGKALITSLVANSNNGENATYSITLTGFGSISKTTSGSGGDDGGEE
jgi:TP901-1 family phage major tail protein